MQTLSEHGYWVEAAALLADGSRIVMTSSGDTAKIRENITGECTQTLSEHVYRAILS